MARREYTIILVRGTGLDREIEKTIFQRRGFRLIPAETGSRALELARSEAPDLVVLGLDMRDLSGPDACTELKCADRTHGVPVVIVAEKEDEEETRRCEQAGADAVVSRSSGLDNVMEIVAQLLGIAPRRPIRMTVMFDVHTGGGRRQSMGRAVNLSEAGMGLEVDRPFHVDTEMLVRFLLPGDRKSIEAQARVRWVRERTPDTYAMGVEFTEIREPHRQRLNGFLDQSLSVP